MKCPYCATQIEDQALVCPVCHRDLFFFQPISARLSRIEESIEQIRSRSQNNAQGTVSASPEQSSPPDPVIMRCLIALAASVLLASFFSWVTWPFETSAIDDKVLNFMSGFVPFFAAIGLGRSVKRLGWSSYAILGLLAGSLGFSQVALHYSTHNEGRLNPDFWLLAVVYSGSGILSFLAGGILGQRMKGEDLPSAPSNDYYLDEFTFRFIRRRCKSRGKLFFRSCSKPWQSSPFPWLGSLTPVLKPTRNHNLYGLGN